MDITIKKRFLITTFIFTVGIQFGYGQSLNNSSSLQEKYWNYRERFKRTHINIGTGVNASMPLQMKFHFQRAGQVAPSYSTPNCGAGESGVMMSASDNTLFDIGDYLAVLSTEIALLRHNNQDYKATMQELYFALAALNRLDREGEKYLDPDLPLSLDGRFIRDQYDQDASKNWEYYDTTKYISTKSYSTFRNYIDFSYPPIGDCAIKDYEPANIMSKDEIIGMLWGLAFVKKYVPNEFVDRNGNDGIFVVDEAINIANRIMTYLTTIQSHEKKCGFFNQTVTMSENWVVLYPLVEHRGFNSQYKQDAMIGNDNFYSIAPPIVSLGNYITGNSYSHVATKSRDPNIPSLPCFGYTQYIDHAWRYNLIVRALAMDRNSPNFLLQTIYFPASYVLFRVFEDNPDAAWVSASLNIAGSLVGPMHLNDAYKIMKNYKIDLKFELAYAQFRNTAPSQPKSYWLNVLNDAPECDYIRVDTAWNDFNCEFFGRSMFGKKIKNGLPNHDHGYIGYRGGIDYMLLYNLFHLQYEKNTESYSKSACDCERRSQLYSSPCKLPVSSTT